MVLLKFKPSTTATANESYKSNQSTTYSPRGRKQDQIDNDIDLDGPLLTNFESSDKENVCPYKGTLQHQEYHDHRFITQNRCHRINYDHT